MAGDKTNKNDASSLHDYFNGSFDATKYTQEGSVEVGEKLDDPFAAPGEDGQKMLRYFDGSDAFANLRKTFVSLQHVPSGRSIFFKAFIENFVENFNPSWKSEVLYGRPDPVYIYENTTRSFSLRIAIPSATQQEAYENLGKVQKLAQFLYPNYTKLTNPVTGQPDLEAQTISQSPLLRLKVMNLAQKAQNGDLDLEKKPFELFQGYNSDSASAQGLLGILRNLTIEHNIDSKGAYIKASNTILPKLINISFDYDVIHEHALGWDEESNFSNEFFPYGVAMQDPFKKATQENPGMSFDQIIEKIEQDKKDAAKAQAELEAAQSKFRNVFTGAPNAKSAQRKLDRNKRLNEKRGEDRKKAYSQAEIDYLNSIANPGGES
tara:strand:- start:188 stop:1321 length:1134 start_codon:yes stop_codon:yes gene_type:complete